MSMKYKTDTDRQQFWEMAIDTWRLSGLSARDFSKREGLSKSALYYWNRKLSMDRQPVEAIDSQAFIEVTLPENKPALLELVLVSGNILRIDTAVESAALTNVLSALREAGLC